MSRIFSKKEKREEKSFLQKKAFSSKKTGRKQPEENFSSFLQKTI